MCPGVLRPDCGEVQIDESYHPLGAPPLWYGGSAPLACINIQSICIPTTVFQMKNRKTIKYNIIQSETLLRQQTTRSVPLDAYLLSNVAEIGGYSSEYLSISWRQASAGVGREDRMLVANMLSIHQKRDEKISDGLLVNRPISSLDASYIKIQAYWKYDLPVKAVRIIKYANLYIFSIHLRNDITYCCGLLITFIY